MFDFISLLFKLGGYNKKDVAGFVGQNITSDEYKTITGDEYTEG